MAGAHGRGRCRVAAVAIAAAVFLVLLAVANIIVVQQHGGSATSRASTPSEDAAVARAVAALHARLTNRSPTAPPTAVSDTTVFLGIKSGNGEKYRLRRDQWRASDCAVSYASAGISWKFMVGVPMDPKGHDLTKKSQSAKDTLHERQLATMLQEEVDQFGDINVLPMRDQYQDLTNKFLGVAQYAFFRTSAKFLGIQDDEFCLHVDRLDDILLNHIRLSPTKELWIGRVKFAGDEYPSMLGIAGMRAPYMSGWFSIFSRRLLGLIVEDDWTHTVLASQYGTQMDDSNAGKWVQHAIRKHNIEVEWAIDRDMSYEVASSCIDTIPDGETNKQGNGCAAYYPRNRAHTATRACEASRALNDTGLFAAAGLCCACDGWAIKRTVCCGRLNVTGGEGEQPELMGMFEWARHIVVDHRPVYINAFANYLYFGGRQQRWMVSQNYTTSANVTVASLEFDTTGCPHAARNRFGVVRRGSTAFNSAGNPNRDPWDTNRPITVACADPQHFARTAAVSRVQRIKAFPLGAAHMCAPAANHWLGVFPDSADSCAALVVAHRKCSNRYFNYAEQGDRNCGCLAVGTKCATATTLNWYDKMMVEADRQYGIVAFRIELNHSSYIPHDHPEEPMAAG